MDLIYSRLFAIVRRPKQWPLLPNFVVLGQRGRRAITDKCAVIHSAVHEHLFVAESSFGRKGEAVNLAPPLKADNRPIFPF